MRTCVVQFFITVPGTPAEMHEELLHWVGICLNFLDTAYINILMYCLEAFSCTDIGGTKYLWASSDEQCYTTQVWYKWCGVGKMCGGGGGGKEEV